MHRMLDVNQMTLDDSGSIFDNLTDLESRLTEVVERQAPMVDSKTIGYIAAKRHFDVDKEHRLMDKAKTTKCLCKHNTFTQPCCLYRNCRHNQQNHFQGVGLV
jgi:hypothetical protein